jgi:membrane protein implicated in regulation of membrane protease activity
MEAWLLWIAAAALLASAEMLTWGLFLAPLAAAAVLAAVLAALGVSFSVSLATFAVAALLLLVAVRPLVIARWRAPVGIRTGAAALVGSRAVALERLDYLHAGAVRLNGEVWTARTYGEDEVIEPGTVVHVIEIQGATALVTE